MKKVIITAKNSNVIDINKIGENDPIFAKRQDKFMGMVLNILNKGFLLYKGWEYDDENGEYECFNTVEELISEYEDSGYEFFVEDYEFLTKSK